MKKWILLGLVVVIAATVMMEGEVDGTVFIATKSGQIMRLGAVEVMAYEEAPFLAHLREKRVSFLAECPTEDEFNGALKKRDLENYEKLRNAMDFCLSVPFYTDGMPAPLVSVTTDADGRYKISVPRHKSLLMVATTSRVVGLREEHYLWVAPIDLGLGYSQKVDMDNHNMRPRAAPEHMFPEWFGL